MNKADKTVLHLTAHTDKGKIRSRNEDNFVCTENLADKNWVFNNQHRFELLKFGALMMVADGMGGNNSGNIASQLAVEGVKEYFDALDKNIELNEELVKKYLNDSILYAHNKIINHAENEEENKGMGTTAIIAWIIESKLYIMWSGDSRAYLYRQETGLLRLSKDHSFVQNLINNGELTYDQAFYHPDNHLITQSLGDKKKPPQPEFASFCLQNNDRLLLCSDGLNSMLKDDSIELIIKTIKELHPCALELINNANNRGGHDNTTVIICDIINTSPVAIPESDIFNKKNKHTGNYNRLHFIIFIAVILAAISFSFAYWVNIKNRKNEKKITKEFIINDSTEIKKDTTKIDDTKKAITKIKEFEKIESQKTLDKNLPDTNIISVNGKFKELDSILNIVEIEFKKLPTINNQNTNNFKNSLYELQKETKKFSSKTTISTNEKNTFCTQISETLILKEKLEGLLSTNFNNSIEALNKFKIEFCE